MIIQEGDTPLLCGCWHGYHSVVECLVEAGCFLHAANKEGETALHVAAVRGYYTIVRLLCERGANLDAQDKVSGCGLRVGWEEPTIMLRTRWVWVGLVGI